MIDRFNKALDFTKMFFILSGGLYFLYYILQYNKLIYALLSVLIYVVSFLIRHFLIKRINNAGPTEIGMFFISMIFLAYTLYIFKLDRQVVEYLPDKLLINAGELFIILLAVNLLPKGKSGGLSILTFLTLLVLIVFRSKFSSIFYTYPWIASFITGTPYIYLLSLLTGMYELRTTDNPRRPS